MNFKTDFQVFGGFYLGMILGTIGVLLGLFMIFFKGRTGGLLIILISIIIGRYLIFKARRGKGQVHYYGGRY